MRRKIFSIAFVITAFLGALLGVIHLLNTLIFSLSGKRNELNGVWKSEYGDIAFTEAGSGPPLLLVHGVGIGAGSSEWEKNIEELSAVRTVYALDLPGFGNSEKRKMTYNSYYYARVINDFISKVIGRKTDAAALCEGSGIVLAGAALCPRLYNSVTVVNPYGESMGKKYIENSFVRRALPLPIIGTMIYNFVSSRQSVLAFLDNNVPVTESYAEIQKQMVSRYANAHRFGADNKYSLIALVNGYLDTPVFRLMENCPVKLNVVISGRSPFPMLPEKDGLTITEIKSGELYPNIYFEEFNRLLI